MKTNSETLNDFRIKFVLGYAQLLMVYTYKKIKYGCSFTVDNNPGSEHNNPKKCSQLKKIFDGEKRFIKKEEEEDQKPASFETSKNEKKSRI